MFKLFQKLFGKKYPELTFNERNILRTLSGRGNIKRNHQGRDVSKAISTFRKVGFDIKTVDGGYSFDDSENNSDRLNYYFDTPK